ncbi:peptidylprolyl isomerase [Myxococcus fulvus]|uniref:Peptidyl-prolyl cis-trans isomerase n=1 Tax=Myxococcus fulvus TaxID=33 RepID=A0A511T6P8_MYXFU|nr:FKBP-type peptidyl-prolyl cis-trans isomerase [Myxococcus fulvus]GEN09850.1 hypothetical protein MFU01_48870 [Myxococcus fulvus]SEU26349.1 peptidylprolyl isomerase [Myxococcus fulvus]
MLRRFVLLCALVLPLVGCGDDPKEPTPPVGNPDDGDPTKVTYAASLNVDLAAMTRLDSGLFLLDQEVGTGPEAVVGRRVQVHYTGWFPDGTRFTTSEGGPALAFDLGAGFVIKGWDQGVVGMRVGGKRRLILPYDLAYGAEGNPPRIPPYSVLIFDTELVSVR